MRWNKSTDNFRADFSALLDSHAAELVAEYQFVEVPANRPPWTATGIKLAAGDGVTLFCAGRAHLIASPYARVEAHSALWARVGTEGPIFRAARGSYTFIAEKPGELYLTNLFPGAWADRSGTLGPPPNIFKKVAGTFEVLVIRWRGEPARGLEQMAQARAGRGIRGGRAWRAAESNAAAARVGILMVGRRRAMLQRNR